MLSMHNSAAHGLIKDESMKRLYMRRFYIAFNEIMADKKRCHDLLTILGLIASFAGAGAALVATILIG